MRIKALIFDVDGTLADTEEAHRRAFNAAFAQQGLDWNWTKPRYAELLATAGGKERIGAFIDSLRLPPPRKDELAARIEPLHAAKTAFYTSLVKGGQVPLRDGVSRLLEEAEQAGVRLAIASTTTLANIEALLCTHFGARALERFAVIGASEQARRKKPAPDIYRFVLHELGAAAHECVAIEDSAMGLAAAKGADLFTVVTPSYWTRREDFAAADLLLPSLGSVLRPLADHAAALLGAPMLGIGEIERQLAGKTRLRLGHRHEAAAGGT